MIEVILMTGADGAPVDESGNAPGRGDLTRVRTQSVDVFPERAGAAHHRLDGHGTCHVGGDEELACRVQSQGTHCRHPLGPVEQGEAFFCLEGDRLQIDLGGWDHLSVNPHLPLADDRQRHVGEGRQVT
jgi:hypothetical protein